MRIPQSKLQRAKAGIHLFQTVLVFIAGCLTLAVMTKSGGFGGQTGFFFALCFLTLPAITYQVMVPMWSRAWRLNNVWAIATIDLLYTLLWFAASIAVAVWNANGIGKGRETNSNKDKTTTKQDTKKDGTCASFGYGSKSKCEASKASVGFGIIIFLLFALTSYVAIRAVFDYRRTGVVPNRRPQTHGTGAVTSDDDGEDKVWSTNTSDINNPDDRLAYSQKMEDDQEHSLLHHNVDDLHEAAGGLAHPGKRPSWESHAPPAPLSYDPAEGSAPSALSPTDLPSGVSPPGRVQFPEANYSRI